MNGQPRPLGFVLLEWGHVLIGIIYLLFGLGNPLHIPLGLLFILGGYGIWKQTYSGVALLGIVWSAEIAYTAYYGLDASVVISPFLVFGYLFLRRDKFGTSNLAETKSLSS